MSKEYRTSYKVYSAWNYQKEAEDLNEASRQGWQLVKGGCFHCRFVKNPDVRYIYQLDFGRIDDLPRYIETFREQGWEYINSTFNGWHYLRKLYDPALPEEEYEIFTDMESLHEMNSRWARFALVIGILIGIFAVLQAVFTFRQMTLPALVQFLVFAFESLVLIRGGLIMRNQNFKGKWRGDSAFMAVFLGVIVIGMVIVIALGSLRPDFTTEQRAETVDAPVVDNQWLDFEVRYPDNYYLDLDFSADLPMTFEIVNAAGEAVYSQTGTSFKEEDIRLKLSRGKYHLTMSADSGFQVSCSLE